jgi:hypothetical protein
MLHEKSQSEKGKFYLRHLKYKIHSMGKENEELLTNFPEVSVKQDG